VPAAWFESATCTFEDRPDSNVCIARNGEASVPLTSPPSPAACVALASCGVEALDDLERTARQLCELVAPWRSRLETHEGPPTTCEWELAPVGGVIPSRRVPVLPSRARFALSAASRAIEDSDRALFEETESMIRENDAAVAEQVRSRTGLRIDGFAAVTWWELACARDLRVPREAARRDHGLGASPRSLRDKRFAELPSPVPGIMKILLAGFGCGAYDRTRMMVAIRPPWAALARLV
jgi:hypothetical protein